jgi:hypothetical protein
MPRAARPHRGSVNTSPLAKHERERNREELITTRRVWNSDGTRRFGHEQMDFSDPRILAAIGSKGLPLE